MTKDQQMGSGTRYLAMFCFVVAGAFLIASLIQATSAGAGQAGLGFKLPESRVMAVRSDSGQRDPVSLIALLYGSAAR